MLQSHTESSFILLMDIYDTCQPYEYSNIEYVGIGITRLSQNIQGILLSAHVLSALCLNKVNTSLVSMTKC